MSLVLLSIFAVLIAAAVYSFIKSSEVKGKRQNDELMPERMVEFAGFVDLPKD